MRPFKYDEAKAGKKVCTRDGRPARIICWDRKGHGEYSIVALILLDTSEATLYYNKQGENEAQNQGFDLMMKPEYLEGWINLFVKRVKENEHVLCGGRVFGTQDDADVDAVLSQNQDIAFVATCQIKWEDKK